MLLTVAGHSLSLLGLLHIGAAGAVLVLGVYPLLTDEPLQESLFFFLFCLAVVVWLFGFGFMYGAPNEERAFRWLRFAYTGVPLIPAALYTVAAHSLGVADDRRWVLGAVWSTAALFLFLTVGTDVVIEGLHRYSWGYYPDYAVAGAGFTGYVLTGVGAALWEYLRRYRLAGRGEEERERARRYLMAFGVGSLAVVDFLPCYGVETYPLGGAVISVMAVMIAGTIRRHHLTELSPAFAADRILETAMDPVLVADEEGEIQVTNPAVSEVLGYAEGELTGARLELLSHQEDEGEFRLSQTLGREGVRDRAVVLESRDGSAVEARVSASAITDRNDRRVGTAVVIRDVRERKSLEHRALHDPLTDLPNRVLFRDRLEQAVAKIRREGGEIAVLFLDLDHFKAVNDGLGHAAGDQVLRETARRLEDAVREPDTVARVGGDEFTVLVEDVGAAEDVRRVASRLTEAVRAPVRAAGEEVHLDVSIGAAHLDVEDGTLTPDIDRPDELVERADAAMFRAKERPASPLVTYDSIQDGA